MRLTWVSLQDPMNWFPCLTAERSLTEASRCTHSGCLVCVRVHVSVCFLTCLFACSVPWFVCLYVSSFLVLMVIFCATVCEIERSHLLVCPELTARHHHKLRAQERVSVLLSFSDVGSVGRANTSPSPVPQPRDLGFQ